ncbi:MAG: hypothetical protein A2073_04125 [Deltaproteobacteria bacterium GWC2_42_11]|nr:MAG: hypothetical protein A2073_04125 [Deltaproteobacteria bacterium GWC2_42_11]HBO85134.1 hypothetical protein [Deltaproteobacteria bacterium]
MGIIKTTYKTAWQKMMEFEWLLIILVICNLVFIIMGQWMVMNGVPEILELRKEMLKDIPSLPYLKPLLGSLAPYLSLKILYTFFFNLIFGAFLSTTITGIVFFLPFFITMGRALYVGILFYGITDSIILKILFAGTFLLEFGGYVFSTAAGINLGLSIAFPKQWKKKEKIGDALKEAINDIKWFYVIAAALLFFGAVWEMGWIHFMGIENFEKFRLD